MGNEQYGNNGTTGLTKRIRTDIPIKENRTPVKKRRSRPCHKPKETGTETITSDIHKTRRTTVYKELPRRLTP